MHDMKRQAGIVAGLASVLATGLAAPLNAQPDQLSETYRDWAVSCRTVAAEDGNGPQRFCEMRQELRQQEGGQRVLSITLRRDQTGNDAVITLVVPFGLDVRDDTIISVGDHMLPAVPFETCLPRGCIAGSRLAEPEIELLRRGENALIALPMLSEATLDVTVSLMGFTAAWARLGELVSTPD